MAVVMSIPAITNEMISVKRMNPFSWTLNDWYIVFQVFSLFLLAGTVLTGAGALITGYILNQRQSEEIAKLNLKRLEMEKLLKEPRRLDWDRVEEMLKKSPKGSASFLYAVGNGDARSLAIEMFACMSVCGWRCSRPEPGDLPITGVGIQMAPQALKPKFNDPNVKIDDELSEPARSLWRCLMQTIEGCSFVRVSTGRDRNEDNVVILVGSKF